MGIAILEKRHTYNDPQPNNTKTMAADALPPCDTSI